MRELFFVKFLSIGRNNSIKTEVLFTEFIFLNIRFLSNKNPTYPFFVKSLRISSMQESTKFEKITLKKYIFQVKIDLGIVDTFSH